MDPLVTEVVDKDGRHHHAATESKFVRDGLADGSLRRAEDVKAEDSDPKPLQEVPDAAEASADSGDHNTTGVDRGPEHGAGDGAPTARGNRSRKA